MANYRPSNHYHGSGPYPRTENGRWVPPSNMREGLQDDFRAARGTLPNGFVDRGSPYIEIPVSAGSSSSGQSTGIGSFFRGWIGRANSNAQAEGGNSPGGTSGAGSQWSRDYGGTNSDYSEHQSRIFESKGHNGNYSRNLGDLPRVPVQEETRTNEIKVSHEKIAILEKHNNELEQDLRATLKKFHSERLRAEEANRHYEQEFQGRYEEKVRAEALEMEIRRYKGELQRLSREKDRAGALENEKQEIQRKLEGLSRDEDRADALAKENQEMQRKLVGLSREKDRADALAKEYQEMQRKLVGLLREKDRADALAKENQEMQRKLEGLSREKDRVDAIAKENQQIQRKLEELHREKDRADAIEKENQEMQGTLEGLSRDKDRADAIEKENQEIQRKLEELSQQKDRADSLESENREYHAKLKKEEESVAELHSKLLDAFAAIDLKDAQSKTLQNALEGIRLENQELIGWKLQRESKIIQDTNPAGQFRTKVASLTYEKAQAEKKEQQLRIQVQEQTKRIEDLKQQNEVLAVKMGASESQVHSLRERLNDKREKLQQKSAEVEELKQQMKPQAIIANKEAQVDDQEARALKAQCSVLEQRVQSKELETQTLSLTISKLNERLQQCDLEIDDLKHQLQDRENRHSEDFVAAPPNQFVGGESFLETEATPYLLDRAVQRVHEGAGIFVRLLMKASEQGMIDGMAVARSNYVRSISLGKAAPIKYVLEAITCNLLFQSFEHECFDLQYSTSGFLDMDQQSMDNFRQYKYLSSVESVEQLVNAENSLFTQFCRIKLARLGEAVPELKSMVQEIISHTFDRSFSFPDTSTDVATYLAAKLGSTFVKLAVCVWQVHKLAFAFNPVARIFRVAQNERFVEKYMQSVIIQELESEDEDMSTVDISRVDFMVVPGLLINRIVVRSRVFVVTKPVVSVLQDPSDEIQIASM